jgi:DNA-binding phage protein
MDWNHALGLLRDDKGGWTAIARETGLSGNQVRRLAHGETLRPRIDTVEKIIDYYIARQNERTAA